MDGRKAICKIEFIQTCLTDQEADLHITDSQVALQP